MDIHSSLTPAQQQALAQWQEESENRMFLGTSAQTLAKDFARANELKKTDPLKGAEAEDALFAICGFKDPRI